jgi:Uma2 family endonuclease
MVVLSPRALPDIRLSIDEYLEADLPEGNRYELVDGVIEMPPAPDMGHENARDGLNGDLYEYRRTHPKSVAKIAQQATVPIPGKASAREPDIAVYAQWPDKPSARGRKAWKEVVPLLVVEVVPPDQSSRDYRDKREDYWLAGIAEYWIVDAQTQRVTVLTRGQQDWNETVVRAGQEARSTVLPGLSIAVDRLFT